MAMPPLDKKGQNALAIMGLFVVAAGLYWYLVWSDAQVAIRVVAVHADSLEASNARIKKEISGGAEAKLRAEADRYTSELAGLRRLVPTTNEVPAMVDAISTAARQVGLEVAEFAPDGELPGEDFNMVKYRFGVIGPYHKVAELLTSIASSPRIISPINVQVAASGPTESRRPKSNETFVKVNFGVITYVAKTAPPAPATAPAPKPAATKPGAK
jgi:type IV pilus assembly protein PilO